MCVTTWRYEMVIFMYVTTYIFGQYKNRCTNSLETFMCINSHLHCRPTAVEKSLCSVIIAVLNIHIPNV